MMDIPGKALDAAIRAACTSFLGSQAGPLYIGPTTCKRPNCHCTDIPDAAAAAVKAAAPMILHHAAVYIAMQDAESGHTLDRLADELECVPTVTGGSSDV